MIFASSAHRGQEERVIDIKLQDRCRFADSK
jgi:hypothetical protein